MNKQAQEFLTELLAAPSPSGFEQPAAKLWRDYVKPYADELTGDVHGNSIAVLNPNAD
ncbi:MAG: M42 family peptidase, partial [Planctomycetota bacterium]